MSILMPFMLYSKSLSSFLSILCSITCIKTKTIEQYMPCSHIFGGSHIFVASFPVVNDSSCVWLDSPKSSQVFADTYFYQLLALNKCWMSKDFHVLCQCHFNYNYSFSHFYMLFSTTPQQKRTWKRIFA
jgi:hypothetical protein